MATLLKVYPVELLLLDPEWQLLHQRIFCYRQDKKYQTGQKHPKRLEKGKHLKRLKMITNFSHHYDRKHLQT